MVSQDELRKEAKRILEDGKVKYVIGWKKSDSGLISAPVFIKNPEEAEDLIWDPACVHNLVKFLVDEKKRKSREKKPDLRPVGIVVKGCDSRAINVLLQEKFIDRGNVHIIGVSCQDTGVVDRDKLDRALKGKKVLSVAFGENGNFQVETDKGAVSIPAADVLAERCSECQASVPVIYDVLLGDKDRRKPDAPFHSLEKMEKLSQKERWDFWKDQFEKCIRCYACRSACPMCFCEECVVDSIIYAVTPATTAEEKAQKIKWLEKSPTDSENFVYHLTRAIHLAGRCIDCGECERVCPMDIHIRFLNKKLEKISKEFFDYEAGFDPDAPSLVSSFKDEDPEEFIR